MLILKAVSLGPMHGYGVLLRIRQISKQRQGLLAGEWGESENKRRARYYLLTQAVRRSLQARTRNWNPMGEIIAGVPGTASDVV